MDYKESLIKEFGSLIFDAYLVKENNLNSLEVILNEHNFEKISIYTKSINEFIDRTFPNNNLDFISVLSKGINLEYQYEELNINNELLKFYLDKSVKGKNIYIGKIIEKKVDQILISWNNHGRFQKQLLDKNNLKKIEKYIKL